MVQKILSFVGWFGTALVFGAVVVRFTRPQWDQYAVQAAWAGLACVVLYSLGQWREVVTFFQRRQARYGALATVSVLVALAIVVAVNYLFAREHKRWDLTSNRQNSLSQQTIKILTELKSPVKFMVFDRQTDLDRFRSRLDEYAYQSRQVSAEYIDPDTKPVVAKQYEIQSYGTVVVEYMGRRERATSDSEQDLTNAIIKVMSGTQRTIYFLQGHGEKDPTRTEREGYSAVGETLKRDNYKIETLVLAQLKDVPANATAVIAAGPTSDLLPDEVQALTRYLANAGKVMILLDPSLLPAQAYPNLVGLLKDWSVEVGNNIIVDVSGASNDPSLAVAANYPSHPVTDRFTTLTVYPVARSVEPVTGGAGGRTAQAIVETSPRSWAEVSLDSLKAKTGVKMEPEKGDKQGPVAIAVAVSAPVASATPATPEPPPAHGAKEPPTPESRLVVFGDADFPSNAYGGIPGNPNLFANAVNWLAQQENLIAIRPAPAKDRRVTMTARQQQGVFLASILVLPVLIFGSGIYVWWRRR